MTKQLICAALVALLAPLSAMAQSTLSLSAELSPPNQTGTNPEFREDPLGVVPSQSTGTFSATLDLDSNELRDIVLDVQGMNMSDLKNFGPNGTPFHLHLPNSGEQGDFGFNVIDLLHGAPDDSLMDTETGFRFTRAAMSILEAEQGNYMKAGVHPRDENIARLLQEGFPFVLVHSDKPIFTNTNGKFPTGEPTPVGFPFGELRGEIVIGG